MFFWKHCGGELERDKKNQSHIRLPVTIYFSFEFGIYLEAHAGSEWSFKQLSGMIDFIRISETLACTLDNDLQGSKFLTEERTRKFKPTMRSKNYNGSMYGRRRRQNEEKVVKGCAW